MDKILTISIPTYNRPKELQRQISQILATNLMGLIEVNVHDNSDRDIQNLNKSSCSDVNYFPNSSNIGYGGNVRSCIQKANGRYLYIISDDDVYNFSLLPNILDVLMQSRCGVLALTCCIDGEVGAKFNTLYASVNCKKMILGDVLDNTSVVTPFNLLPSMIAETAIMKKGEREFRGRENDYMHSAIFFMGANRDTKVAFDDSGFLVTYNVPETVQSCFELSSLLNSKEEIGAILKQQFNVRRKSGREILEVSKWCFMNGIHGAPSIPFGFHEVVYFSFKSILSLQIFPIAFIWLGLFPIPLRSQLYNLYLKLKRMK